MKKEIRITGFGGQGIMLAGYIMGKAASIYDKKHASMVQAYGPEARGSACAAQVIVSDHKINYPYVREQEILLAMSQEGFDKYVPLCGKDAVVLYDENLVEIEKPPKVKIFKAIPSTRLAEKNARRMVANMVMLGFFTAQTDVISPEAMKEAILSSVPKGTGDLNIKAFELGLNYDGKKEDLKKASKKGGGDS